MKNGSLTIPFRELSTSCRQQTVHQVFPMLERSRFHSVLDQDDEDPYLKGVKSQESSEHYKCGCAGPGIRAT